MEVRFQLLHPAGKKAVRMDHPKYATLRKAILHCLKTNGALSHKNLVQAVHKDFENKKEKFEGSLEWYLEWVKLDLEARKEIRRLKETAPVKFELVNQITGM